MSEYTMTNQNASEPKVDMLEELREMDAAQLMLLGMCQQIGRSIHRIEQYRGLLADELENCGGNVDYLDKICLNFDVLRKLAAETMRHCATSAGSAEPLRLRPLVQGVVERIFMETSGKLSLRVDIDPEMSIYGDAFTLQKMFFRLIRSLIADDSTPYIIKAQTIAVDENERHGCVWKDASFGGDFSGHRYVKLAIMPAWASMPELKELIFFGGDNGEETGLSEERMLQNTHWLGEARFNGGLLFRASGMHEENVVLLFPSCLENDANKPESRFAQGTAGVQKHEKPQQQQRTILLVDDEDMIWDVISDMLQNLGYQVILAGDGQEAVEICAANPGAVNLVILDMLMPNMGGKEAFFKLKAVDPAIKVLISSGYVSQEEIQDVMDAGAAGFLRKPYRMMELDQKIREILS